MIMIDGNFEVFTEANRHTIKPLCCSSDWQNHEELNTKNINRFSVEPNLNDNASVNWKYPCRIIVTFD
jgi:hypothetical protein